MKVSTQMNMTGGLPHSPVVREDEDGDGEGEEGEEAADESDVANSLQHVRRTGLRENMTLTIIIHHCHHHYQQSSSPAP